MWFVAIAAGVVGIIIATQTDLIEKVYNIIETFFMFTTNLVNIIPSPFNIIFGVFLGVYLTIILYKAVK